jgi:hypothetical protein
MKKRPRIKQHYGKRKCPGKIYRDQKLINKQLRGEVLINEEI